jgi:hypothetical protein
MAHSPLHSFIIEQVLGLYLLIMAIIIAARTGYYRNVVKDLVANKALVLVSASFTLVIGLIMIVIHNLWLVRFDLLVTIIAWLIVIKAILWLAFPEFMANLIKKFTKTGMYIAAGIQALIGILLLTQAYHVFNYPWF